LSPRLSESDTIIKIWCLKDNGVTTLTSRARSTCGGRLPTDGPLWPCIYLAPLWIWRLENNGVMILTLWGYVIISHLIIRLAAANFLWVVHSDHVFIWHRYGDVAVW